ncbi:DUF6153 family protein [Agromyces sp. Soil535]|uniref:DUF6153 family protein n=1 Tax=Agromyces sp. Soil535 TaxID=1736390 RepID=UPI0006F80891|nr:DUF6153 family protein [Agromyces sp. Soil535]KRE30991.1 hypothetical protein ASG80_00335 [Agromyces sp. Soil535]
MIFVLRARRNVAWLRLLLALTAVPAILAGLLAMHVLSGGGDESTSAGHHAVALTQPAGAGAMTAGTDHHEAAAVCGPDCEREHQVSAVACVLALLVAAFALAIGTGWFRIGWLLRPVRYLSVTTRSPADPSPPSLLALSISRT